MLVNRIAFLLCICFLPTQVLGQHSDGVLVKNPWNEVTRAFHNSLSEESPARNARISFEGKKDEFKYVDTDWECIGPNVQPMEKNPGGLAIPSYSIGRGNGTGRINYIYINPSDEENLFACSPTGGLFVTYNKGNSWKSAGTDQLPISGVASVTVNPDDQDQWIIASGDSDDRFMFSDGVWRTLDAGDTWKNISGIKANKSIPLAENSEEWTFISHVVSHPCDFNRVMVASNKGLFISNNALDEAHKVKWKRISESRFYDIEISPWNESIVFASGERIMMSRDCGNTWEYQPLPAIDNRKEYPFTRINMEMCDEDDEHLYAIFTFSQKNTVSQSEFREAEFMKYHYRSRKWIPIKSLDKERNNVIPFRARAFDISPTDSTIILMANIHPVYRSTDGGKEFNSIERGQMHDDVHHLAFASDGNTVWASHDGGVSISYDKGLSWEARDLGIGATNVHDFSVAQSNETQLLIGALDTGSILFKDGKWYHVNWGDGFASIIDPNDPDLMFSTRQNGQIMRSMDGGETWENSVSNPLSKSEWHTCIGINSLYSNIIYCGGDHLGRSTSQGEEWETIFSPKDYDESLSTAYQFYLSEENPEVMYVYFLKENNNQAALYRTFNLNKQNVDWMRWEELELPRDGWISGLAIDPDDPKKFWMAYEDFMNKKKFFRYNGNRWIEIDSGLGYSVIGAIIVEKDSDERLYLGTNYGVFTRNKNESEWSLMTGLPGTYIKSMDINYTTQKLLVGTYGRGVWQTDLSQPE